MSDALWMDAASDTSIGSATIESDDNLFTIAAHGLDDGDRVVVSNLSGGATGNIAEGGVYWVTQSTTDEFAVSLTKDGLPVEFDVDGGADVNRFQPAYTAAELRRLISSFLAHGSPDGFHDRFGARQGVFPTADSETVVQVSASTWTTRDLTAVVYPAATSQSGPYVVAHPADAGTVQTADGSNDRIDRLDLQIQDHEQDASGFRRARIVYTAGDPDPAPVAPTQVDNSLELSTFRVVAGGGGFTQITQPQMTVARGGILPVRDEDELPTDNTVDGSFAWQQDIGKLLVAAGDTPDWFPVAQRGGWETIVDETITGTTNFPFTAGAYDMVRVFLCGNLDAEGRVTMRINNDGTIDLHQFAWTAYRLDTGAVADSDAGSSTVWSVAQWSTGANNTAQALLLGTDASSNLSFQGSGYRASSGTTIREYTLSGGKITSPLLLSSLRFSASGSVNISSCKVVIEGHRA